jgi:hypothetical protein
MEEGKRDRGTEGERERGKERQIKRMTNGRNI